MADQTGPVLGQQDQTDTGSQFNATWFIAKQLVNGRVNTASLVKVIAVHGGGLDAVGTVDVQPMVNQIDGAGNATPHGTIYGLPYVRIQGGFSAIIIDPVVGDIGQAVYCASDISSVKATKAISNPASRRRFSMADGIYLGGTLNDAPTQYIWLKPDGGIVAVSTGAVSLTDGSGSNLTLNNDHTGSVTQSGLFIFNCPVEIANTLHVTETSQLDGQVTGNAGADFSSDVTANGTSVHGHTHDVVNVQGGSATIPTTAPL